MRIIDEGLAAHLAAGVTTLCRCFRLERRDGAVMGFTDHDRPLAFDGVTYEPADGLDAGETATAAGLAPGGLEVTGALSSGRLAEDDLAAGLYDHAAVRVFLVNWAAPAERHLLSAGHLGEVVREDRAFRAEIRGLAALLDQPKGRIYRSGCDADLGDARCGIDLGSGSYRGSGTVSAGGGRRRFEASGLSGFAAGWFERGRLAWTGGGNAGAVSEVRAHRLAGSTALIELWQAVQHEIAPGDTFTVTAGCDKSFATCRQKFANGVRFRGFPHMPGDDFALSYARKGGANGGGRLVE